MGIAMTAHELWLEVAKTSRRGRWYVLPRGQRALARGCASWFQWRSIDGVRSIRIGMLWRVAAPAMIAARNVIETWAKAQPAQMHYSWARDVASTHEVAAAVKRLGEGRARSVYDRARLLASTCLNWRPLE